MSSLNGSFVFSHFFRFSQYTESKCSSLSAVTVIKLYFKARETGVERIYRLLLTTTLLMLLFCALL